MLFTVWGWGMLICTALGALSSFVRAFGAKDGEARQAAALACLINGVSAWWVWVAFKG